MPTDQGDAGATLPPLAIIGASAGGLDALERLLGDSDAPPIEA